MEPSVSTNCNRSGLKRFLLYAGLVVALLPDGVVAVQNDAAVTVPAAGAGNDVESLLEQPLRQNASQNQTVRDSGPFHGSIENYRQDIEQLEDRFGVYDHRLIEQYSGLGISLKNQGEHAAAIGSLTHAVHLSRVNDGLHNPGQMPMLNNLVESYVAMNQWSQANEKQTYLYSLQQQNYDADDIRLLQPSIQMAQWHLRFYKNEGGDDSLAHLLKARALTQRAAGIVESTPGFPAESLNDVLYRQAQADYYLVLFITENAQSAEVYKAGIGSSMRVSTKLEHELRQMLLVDPYYDGEKVLLRRVDLAQNDPEYGVEGQVEVLIALGDWYLIFGKENLAIETYARAQQLLSVVPQGDNTLNFNKPRPVSFELEPLNLAEKPSGAGKQKGYVQARFDVTASGWADHIEIVDSNPPKIMDSTVRRAIGATRFRPRVIEGEAVLTEGVTFTHQFNFDQDIPDGQVE